MSRGHDRERQVRVLLEREDWWTMRSAGSLGDVDIVAARYGPPRRLLLIEVKSTTDGPYKTFSPADRADLTFAAHLAGGEPWLCWWPPRAKPVWIPATDWPAGRSRGEEAEAA